MTGGIRFTLDSPVGVALHSTPFACNGPDVPKLRRPLWGAAWPRTRPTCYG